MISPAKLGPEEHLALTSVPLLSRAPFAGSITTHRTVGDILPSGFSAIARIFHPARNTRFRDIHRELIGSEFDSTSRWRNLLNGLEKRIASGQDLELPEEGEIPRYILSTVNELPPITELGDTKILYALWEGFAIWGHHEIPVAKVGPYYVFESMGLQANGWWPGVNGSLVDTQSPNVIMPVDSRWIIATPVGSLETLVAGDDRLVNSIIAHDRIDGVKISYSSNA